MTERALVLVVDDEPTIIHALSAALHARQYDVISAGGGAEAIERVAKDRPDVVVLDLGLPDIDGIAVVAGLREQSAVPIIVLTADGAEERKVAALDAGADDYVTKPFSTPELLARIRVALRHPRTGSEDPAVLRVGDIEIDIGHHRVIVAGAPVALTPKEFDFLAVLARQPGRVITQRALLQAVWGPEYGRETEYLRVYASQLRKKLDEDPERPRLITEPGVGYRLVDNSAG